MAEVKQYRPKALIDGKDINQQPGSTWVAIPDKYKGRQLEVVYGPAKMLIKDYQSEVQMYRRFLDKFWTEGSKRRKFYTLGYFRFVADED